MWHSVNDMTRKTYEKNGTVWIRVCRHACSTSSGKSRDSWAMTSRRYVCNFIRRTSTIFGSFNNAAKIISASLLKTDEQKFTGQLPFSHVTQQLKVNKLCQQYFMIQNISYNDFWSHSITPVIMVYSYVTVTNDIDQPVVTIDIIQTKNKTLLK